MIYTPEFAPYQPKHACPVCVAESQSIFCCGFRKFRADTDDYTPRRAA